LDKLIQYVQFINVCYLFRFHWHCSTSRKFEFLYYKKKDITLHGQHGKLLFTCWDDTARKLVPKIGKILLIKNCRRTKYSQCMLTPAEPTCMKLNPKIQEAISLKNWFKS